MSQKYEKNMRQEQKNIHYMRWKIFDKNKKTVKYLKLVEKNHKIVDEKVKMNSHLCRNRTNNC